MRIFYYSNAVSRPIVRCLIALLFLLPVTFSTLASDSQTDVPEGLRQAELVRLVRQDCGSCHGLTLQGGLGPALLPQALANKPVDSLMATIMQGRAGTAMPPWQRFLSESEARWIVSQLQKGFPHEK
jgi:cytochrome c55X